MSFVNSVLTRCQGPPISLRNPLFELSKAPTQGGRKAHLVGPRGDGVPTLALQAVRRRFTHVKEVVVQGHTRLLFAVSNP